MGYKGRIIVVSIYIALRMLNFIIDYIQYNFISVLQIIFFLMFIVPIYYLGFQYDKAQYYKKQVEEVFDSVYIMLWKWDSIENKNIVSVSCEKVYGYTKKDFEDNPSLWLDLVYKEDKMIALEFKEDLLNGKIVSAQYRILDVNGNVKWIKNMANPVLNFYRKINKNRLPIE